MQRLIQDLHRRRCACAQMTRQYPCLMNPSTHVICRTGEQWTAILRYAELIRDMHAHTWQHIPFAQHARQALIPTQSELLLDVQATCRAIRDMSLCTNSRGQQAPVSDVFGDAELDEFCDRLYHMSDAHLQRLRERSPELSSDGMRAQATVLHNLKIRGGCWDKRLYRMYGICRTLEEKHAFRDLLLGARFTIWGWADDECQARVMALYIIIERARAKGIMEVAHKHGLGMAQHKKRAQSR